MARVPTARLTLEIWPSLREDSMKEKGSFHNHGRRSLVSALDCGMSGIPNGQRLSMQGRFRHLESATAALITDVSLDGVLNLVVQVATEVIEALYAAIGVVGPGGGVRPMEVSQATGRGARRFLALSSLAALDVCWLAWTHRV